jgi:hypothetical protein
LVGEGSLERAYQQPLLTEMLRRPRCLDGAKNPGGKLTWVTWFELPASQLDELTPGEYTRIRVGALTPTKRVNGKPSDFSPGAMQLRRMNTGYDARMLTGIAGRLRTDGTRTVRLLR